MTRKLNIVQKSYDDLHSRASTQADMQHKSLMKLQDCNNMIQTFQKEIQQLQQQNSELNTELINSKEYKEQVLELTEQNTFLEKQLTELCELPFFKQTNNPPIISGNRMQHPPNENNTHVENYEQIKLNEEMTKYKEKNQELMIKVKEYKEELKIAKDHLQQVQTASISPAKEVHDIPRIESCDKQNQTDDALWNFQNDEKLPDCSKDEKNSYNPEEQKYQLIVSDLEDKLTDIEDQLEREKKMMQTQIVLNTELGNKLKKVSSQNSQSVASLNNKIDELQIISTQRLERIRYLENQVKETHTAESKQEMFVKNECQRQDDTLGDHQKYDSLIEEATSNSVGADEAILEIRVEKIEFCQESKQHIEKRHILLVDFHGFESQATDSFHGANPSLDFTVSYKLHLTPFTLYLMRVYPIMFELFTLQESEQHVEPSMIAGSSLSLEHMLENALLKKCLRIICPHNENLIGKIYVSLRIEPPIANIQIDKLKENHTIPSPLMAHSTVCHLNPYQRYTKAANDDFFHSNNSCSLTITLNKVAIDVSMLKHDSEQIYIHYQFLGYPDVFTSPYKVDRTSGVANIGEKRSINVGLSYMKDTNIEFSIFKVNHESNKRINMPESKQHIYLGSCRLILEPMKSKQNKELQLTNVINSEDRIGTLTLMIEFVVPKMWQALEMISDTVNGVDMRAVCQPFLSSNNDRIQYNQFLNIADPPYPLVVLIATLKRCMFWRFQNLTVEEVHRLIQKKLLTSAYNTEEGFISFDTFTSVMTTTVETDIREECNDLYRYLDICNRKKVESKWMELFLFSSNIDEIRKKIRQCSSSNNIIVRAPFEAIDKENTGWILLSEFMDCFRSIGFDIDENGNWMNKPKNEVTPSQKS